MINANSLKDMKIYTPKTTSGKYTAYVNKMVVIIPREKNPGKLYFSKPVDDVLGYPDFVGIGIRGSNLYIWSTDKDGGGYKATRGKHDTLRWITITSALKENNIGPGIYDATINNGMVSFDFFQTPSRV